MIVIANTLVANGGTTFLIRMAKEYYNDNDKLKIIVLYDNYLKEHLEDLSRYADVFFIKDFTCSFFSLFSNSQFLPFIINLNIKKIEQLIGNDDTVHVMGIFGYVLAKKIQKIKPDIKITVGVYHQNEFMYKSINCYFNKWVYKEMANLNCNYFIFFNNSMRNAYSKYFKLNLEKSSILPIGIPLKHYDVADNHYSEGLIISVGNLVGFKTYNKHIIKTLPLILNKFPNVKFFIYGVGEELGNLQELVSNLNLSDSVFFKGLLDYNDFDKIVSKAHVFVGNGTAVLEAANVGVPSITGIESCEMPITYGYVHEIDGYDYNEFDENKNHYKFDILLNKLFDGGKLERERISSLCKQKVEKFNIKNTVNGFNKINLMKGERVFNDATTFLFFRLFFSFIYLSLLHVLTIDQRFKYRRNQGVIM
jgi:glycosyltransferase involved in cell wall biosynthesis